MEIREIRFMHDFYLERINLLRSELQYKTSPLSFKDACEIMNGGYWFGLFDEFQNLFGMSLLISYSCPMGKRGIIEDVVVSPTCKGQGWGEKLTLACINKAKELGLDVVNLTSNPTRVAANNLYQKMGFEKRETNCYKMELNNAIST